MKAQIRRGWKKEHCFFIHQKNIWNQHYSFRKKKWVFVFWKSAFRLGSKVARATLVGMLLRPVFSNFFFSLSLSLAVTDTRWRWMPMRVAGDPQEQERGELTEEAPPSHSPAILLFLSPPPPSKRRELLLLLSSNSMLLTIIHAFLGFHCLKIQEP